MTKEQLTELIARIRALKVHIDGDGDVSFNNGLEMAIFETCKMFPSPVEPPVIQCAECGKTPDIDVVVHWQHDCTRDAETTTESTAQLRYETICGTCGQEHHLGTYYNHNFVARVSVNRPAGTK